MGVQIYGDTGIRYSLFFLKLAYFRRVKIRGQNSRLRRCHRSNLHESRRQRTKKVVGCGMNVDT